jgi:prepilin-type N-terminal cleavage/methylation domain-containing protein
MPTRLRADSEAGFSLAEILVTIVIVGVAFTAILDGMMTSITSSRLQRNEAAADALARDAAEAVKNVTVAYANAPGCAVPGTYTSALVPFPGASIFKVEYWNGAPAAPGAPYPVTFPPGYCTDNGLQRITISATSQGVTETVQILKRKPS